MDCQTHNLRRLSRPALLLLIGILAPDGSTADAQILSPSWAAPSTTVWGRPQPTYVPPPPTVTTFYPPASAAEAVAVEPLPNAHLRVAVTESLLSRLLGREVTDTGVIRDSVLGADLYGNQFTVTRLSVDCVPCPDHARLQLCLTGTVTDQTVGYTRPAAIRSEGSHVFQMTKQVDFDGRQFTTRSPAAWVQPQIVYRGITTVVSGVPVIGQIGNAIAYNEAERRKPAAVQYALRRVTQTAAPRFNQEVDEKLSRANQRLRVFPPAWVDWLGLDTFDQLLTTTDDRLSYAVRVQPRADRTSFATPPPDDNLGPVLLQPIDPGESGATLKRDTEPVETVTLPSPLPQSVDGCALTLSIHEDFVNYVLNRAPLEGREVPDQLIDSVMSAVLAVLANMSLQEAAAIDFEESQEPEFATLLLGQDRPVRVRFDDDQVLVTMQSGFRVLAGAEVPVQHVEIPYRMSSSEQHYSWAPGDVSVEPVAPAEESPLVGLARPMIRKQIEQRLQPIPVARTIPVAIPGMTPLSLHVREILLDDGWLVVAID